jgi:hypothetical protein
MGRVELMTRDDSPMFDQAGKAKRFLELHAVIP